MPPLNHSDPSEHPSKPAHPEGEQPDPRKPFVEPELRCESDLIGGTGDRHFFETTASS